MLKKIRKMLGLLTEEEKVQDAKDMINKLQNKFGIPEDQVPWANLRDNTPVKGKKDQHKPIQCSRRKEEIDSLIRNKNENMPRP